MSEDEKCKVPNANCGRRKTGGGRLDLRQGDKGDGVTGEIRARERGFGRKRIKFWWDCTEYGGRSSNYGMLGLEAQARVCVVCGRMVDKLCSSDGRERRRDRRLGCHEDTKEEDPSDDQAARRRDGWKRHEMKLIVLEGGRTRLLDCRLQLQQSRDSARHETISVREQRGKRSWKGQERSRGKNKRAKSQRTDQGFGEARRCSHAIERTGEEKGPTGTNGGLQGCRNTE